VSDLVNWRVDEWKGAEPEQEEGDEFDGVSTGAGDSVLDTTRAVVLCSLAYDQIEFSFVRTSRQLFHIERIIR
jgi:hypothetical protein